MALYYGKNYDVILTFNFREFYTPHEKTNDIFRILRKFQVRNGCVYAKILT